MAKIITSKEAAALIKSGDSVMFGGFMGCGTAQNVVNELAKLGTDNLTAMCNDGAKTLPDGTFYGISELIHNKQFKKFYATHIGLNPEVGQQMNDGSLEVVLIPQGSFAEMLRAGGAGLGGVITPTGVGTIIEGYEYVQGKVNYDGVDYLILKPLKADFAVLKGYKVDKAGNICYHGTARNFNPMMATAAKTVIVEAENLVEIGELDPDNIVTPGMFVDYIVYDGGNK
ncbi:MAG: CoA transferase subunit A [Clostridia bacterium]|nr:CoA transferase subunit A [Clostridia bacterium]MBR4954461.1 CoA transferase subunit A [Clostridia bacterium]MBR5903870.1 CoA transferase subunit A [Clostridia bacterium]